VSEKKIESVEWWLEPVYGVDKDTGNKKVVEYEARLGNSRASRVLATFTSEEIEG
jgi:hypothetical protein